ncbi:MAG TPA: putative motility protein [Arenimonas sp.]|nr:putative motility protein [Arenimonas sp.]
MDSLSASIINASVTMAQTQTAQQIDIAVLKKAMEIQASAAAALLQALPAPVPAGALGQLVDVRA